MRVTPVLLCGGIGQRLWPVSNKKTPKQFVKFFEATSLFQETIIRVSKHFFAPPMIVTNKDFKDIVEAQLLEIGIDDARIILEPEGKNTAAPILFASYLALQDEPECCIIALPCDHAIPEAELFREQVSDAASDAENGDIITFGVNPVTPNTEFGYIQIEGKPNENNSFKVKQFIEKPNLNTAKQLLRNQSNLWNTGIFVFKAITMIYEAEKMYRGLQVTVSNAFDASPTEGLVIKIDNKIWNKIDAVSIDHAVIEHSKKIRCIPFLGSWSDLGSWSGLHKALPGDYANNLKRGDIQLSETKDSIIWSQNNQIRTIAIGLNQLAVIITDDTLLVMPKDCSYRVDEKLKLPKVKAADNPITSDREYRPWGWYESMSKENGYQVKRIFVTPGASLSLQSHEHRSEHWTVASGKALVQLGEKTFPLETNQGVYIERKTKHRLSNPTNTDLIIIEVQIGDYLEEDDIVRYEDDYGRTN